MFALLRLAQVVLRAADDDLALEVDVVGEDLLDRHDLGHPARQRQHDDADGVLELGVGVEAVEHHLGVGVPFQLDDDAHAVPVALVTQVGDLLDPLFLDEVGDRLDQPRLVDHVGDLGDDDPLAAVGHLLDLAAGAAG